MMDAYKEIQNTSSNITLSESSPSRYQVLQHIYTRCQEEVEKNVKPGVALLNKLLRTDETSIRNNQLRHYLGPQKTEIQTPDGKQIDLSSSTGAKPKSLISHDDFTDAVTDAVSRIRQLEEAGAANRVSAANLIESCRQVAIETRSTFLELYGEQSKELLEFEQKLQTVFRPNRK